MVVARLGPPLPSISAACTRKTRGPHTHAHAHVHTCTNMPTCPHTRVSFELLPLLSLRPSVPPSLIVLTTVLTYTSLSPTSRTLALTHTLHPTHRSNRLRKELAEACRGVDDSACTWIPLGMAGARYSTSDILAKYRASVFCLHPPGDSPTRKGIFDRYKHTFRRLLAHENRPVRAGHIAPLTPPHHTPRPPPRRPVCYWAAFPWYSTNSAWVASTHTTSVRRTWS